MDFIKIFDKIVAVDAIKYVETRRCKQIVEVCLKMKEGPELLIHKKYPKNADPDEYADDIMSAIMRTLGDLSDSDCEDIDDYLPYDEDDDEDDDEEEEDDEIITDSSQLYKLEKDHTGTYYTYYR